MRNMKKTKKNNSPLAMETLRKHFGKLSLTALISSNRVFPVTSRPELCAVAVQDRGQIHA